MTDGRWASFRCVGGRSISFVGLMAAIACEGEGRGLSAPNRDSGIRSPATEDAGSRHPPPSGQGDAGSSDRPLDTGDSGHGPPAECPRYSDEIVEVSAGSYLTCVRFVGGSVACWGSQGGFDEVPSDCFEQISAGARFACGVRTVDKAIRCWGYDVSDSGSGGRGWTTIPEGSFSEVRSGEYHVCGRRLDQSVVCWGDLAREPPAGAFTQVSAGWVSSCGLREDGRVECWGGEGWAGWTLPPGGSFRQVSVGAGNHACGLRPSGTVECWGGEPAVLGPPPGGVMFTRISKGAVHGCGVTPERTVACWGRNDSGQADAPSGEFQAVSAGWLHTCGLRPAGSIECWGSTLPPPF